jgi:hypothetical protein
MFSSQLEIVLLSHPIDMPRRCFACMVPSSRAWTHRYFLHPEVAHLRMHAICFVEMTIWVETQTNLGHVMGAWSSYCRRVRSLRAGKALRCVRRWQREQWTVWSNNLCARGWARFGRGVFGAWARWTLTPLLVDSSD